MTRKRLLALCGLIAVGCSAEKRPREPSPIVPVSTVAAPAASAPSTAALSVPIAPSVVAPEPVPTPEELPLPEDFEAEAAQQITATNFRKQLDAIEHEMNAPSSEAPKPPSRPRGVQK